jgi:hypothetical protein
MASAASEWPQSPDMIVKTPRERQVCAETCRINSASAASQSNFRGGWGWRSQPETQCFVRSAQSGTGRTTPISDCLERTKLDGYSKFHVDHVCTLCQEPSTFDDNSWTFELYYGRGIQKVVAYPYPLLADQCRWTLEPDVQAWDG